MTNKITFDEIMDFYPDNRHIFNMIVEQRSSLVPFIGAGLSAFAFPTWRKFLEKSFAKLIWPEKEAEFKQLLDSYHYEEAASFLNQERGKVNFEDDIRSAFSSVKIDEKASELHKEAAFLLPLLFDGLILTTNFDCVLEKMYALQGREFRANGHPGHKEMLNWALRFQGQRTLYKFHGDIAEASKLTLTKEKYAEHYAPGSALIKELTKCFEQKNVLFLGCSLNQDRTMVVLRETLEDGAVNFAILDCEEANRREVARNLGDMGIRAILYPKGRHKAVRVILEKLLELNNNPEFLRLSHCESSPGPAVDTDISGSGRFHYKAGTVGFFGREKELSALKDFCLSNPSSLVKWWAVTGPGGCGKSRLAYEFGLDMLRHNWHVIHVHAYSYEDLIKSSSELRLNTLFIVDYAHALAKEVGRWIETLWLENRGSVKRILLIERDGKDILDAVWAKELGSNTRSDQMIQETCHNKSQFLHLQILEEHVLLQIMMDFAQKRNAELSEQEASELCNRLKDIDPDLQRPLYGLFLVDAWLDKQDPLIWSKEQILDYVVDREIKRFKNCLESTTGNQDDFLFDAFLNIKTMATMLDGLALPDLATKFCPEDWNVVVEKEKEYRRKDLLWKAQLAEPPKGDFIESLKPDLIGEYFVFKRWIRDYSLANSLIQSVWQEPRAAFFFIRLFQDHYRLVQDDERLMKLLLEPPFDQMTEKQIVAFSLFLFSVTIVSKLEITTLAVAKLEIISNTKPFVLKLYARGLVNLSVNQDLEGALASVSRLEALASDHPFPEFITALSYGLVNLINKQDLDSAIVSASRLEVLASDHPLPELITLLAKGLVNLSNKQDLDGALNTVSRLEVLASDHPLPEVITEFAFGLFNLSIDQDLDGAFGSVSRLEALASVHPLPEIITILAEGLVNHSADQDLTVRLIPSHA